MLLDYKYIKKQRKLSVSYVNEQGMKSIMDFNVDKFKTFYKTPTGSLTNWDGSRCAIKYTDDPSKFDLRTFFRELDPKYKALFSGKVNPRLYTFDIESRRGKDGEYAEPNVADAPIATISIVSPELNAIVLGTKDLDEIEKEWISGEFRNYLNLTEYFHKLGLAMPTFRYIKFDTEKDMLEYFLKCIVAKVPILSGWNCIGYDWQYITTRIRSFYPSLSITFSSAAFQVNNKQFVDMKGEKYYLPMPLHTPIVDMMEVIDQFDLSGLTMKESTSLDYIASETPGLGIHKIEYDGDLDALYDKDFAQYVFYNAIDSILVQLINYRYKTLDTMYMQALYCETRIQDTFSKIAVSEALVWNEFYDQDRKVVYEEKNDVERGRLLGAYVAKPIPGKWDYITCNDFASLYPSTIITCNISFDNFVDKFYDDEALAQYIGDPNYIVVGPCVHKNKGSVAKPEVGDYVGHFIDNEKLEPYRKDPNYFVSINGHIYHNDRDYTFKRIQARLKATRNISKYLGKQLDAKVMLDVEHINKGLTPSTEAYTENLVDAMKEMGYNILNSNDLLKMDKDTLAEFKRKLAAEIVFYTCKEQAMKLLGNSMYGGSSHVAFYWFNIDLARDITGEARNLTKHMEGHLPKFWDDNWLEMQSWHKKWGFEVDTLKVKELLRAGKHMITVVYGDTDSLYISYANLLSTIKGFNQMTQREQLDVIVHINTDFLNDHNKKYIDEYYGNRHVKSIHDFELETVALSGLWLNVKKRYCQILLWKDGKYFDADSLPLKVKGLEMTKASYPKFVRNNLKKVVRSILECNGDKDLWAHTNIMVQQLKMEHAKAKLEDICENKGCNGYTKYILDHMEKKSQVMQVDRTGTTMIVASKCPVGPKALGTHNKIRAAHNLPGEDVYGGKCKVYFYRPSQTPRGNKAQDDCLPFAFQSGEYPTWADEYAPVDRSIMFQKYFLDPLNRICGDSMGFQPFMLDGSRQVDLFAGLW